MNEIGSIEVLGLPIKMVKGLKISGFIGDGPVALFLLKQAIYETATKGNNVILC
ncbi:hypothetical protein [Candidatus Rhabdochlamydia porcellionis]|jgi:hypothetical protein|uniref:Uncharacterized protein n=1 Tax=Candidatus Rhabdochlamydia porcellionis TaxID=225148 RepID=A0ABX8YZB1_9BACT|nr:hypothetical protein [Candidatus Rhabdochlamydia porcellionis]QZA58408.1 hypothetical protein RHAB15C_0000281 [Candidatus Rhabdochlamydia porcellionis]